MSAALRFLLPVATAAAATCYLATVVPHRLDRAPGATPAPELVELARCEATGRDADACLDEADGKALVERADGLARADDAARRGSRP